MNSLRPSPRRNLYLSSDAGILPCLAWVKEPCEITIEVPEPPVLRWGPRKKLAIIEALRAGQITFSQICRRYEISPAELDEWLSAYQCRGFVGLIVTKRPRLPSARPLR